jgi:hypothetical protein
LISGPLTSLAANERRDSLLFSIPCKRNRIIQREIPKKLRSVHYYRARESLWRVKDLGVKHLDLDAVIRHFENWRSHYYDKFIHLEKGGHHKFLKSICRFDESYKRSLKSRMKKMQDVDWAVKLEITLDPKQFMGLYDEFVMLPKIWNNVVRWLKRTFGGLEFLRFVEITKKGRPHLHVLVVFHDPKWNRYFKSMNKRSTKKRFQAFYSEFKSVVARNGGGHVWVRPVKGNLKLVNYVLKYVNKSISGPENKKYSALLFASNRRLFSVSRGLRVFAEPKKVKQGFSYVGCVPASELLAYCESKGIPFGFGVDVELSDHSDLYEYSSLFGIDEGTK